METPPGELLAQLAEFDTALLANTIPYLDATPPEHYYMGGSIQSVAPQAGPTVGVAYTCELDSSTPGGAADFEAYWRQLEEFEQEKRPIVWVVKTVGSRPDHECVLGDGMAKTLRATGCLGVVTDGGVRDIAGLATVPFAAYSRGRTVHHCALRFRSPNCAVEVGGITIQTGDVIHADSSGVIRIPMGCLEQLPEKAIKMIAFEREAHLWLRRTDLSARQKRDKLQDILKAHGFSQPDLAR